MKEFCPPNCGLLDYDGRVCREVCWHKDDEVVDPFEAIVFGQLQLIIGKNDDECHLQSGGSVHRSQVAKTGRKIIPGEIVKPVFIQKKEPHPTFQTKIEEPKIVNLEKKKRRKTKKKRRKRRARKKQ